MQVNMPEIEEDMDLLQFNDNKQHHPKDSLQKRHRPHTKADHLVKK